MTKKSRSLCVSEELLPISTNNLNPNPTSIKLGGSIGKDPNNNNITDGFLKRINEFIKKVFGNTWWSLRKKSNSNKNSSSKLNLIQYNVK